MSSGVMITTERLNLRKMTTRDIPNLLQIFSDPVAMRYYPATMNEEETKGGSVEPSILRARETLFHYLDGSMTFGVHDFYVFRHAAAPPLPPE